MNVTEQWTPEQYKAYTESKSKKNKYGAVATETGGKKFGSNKEAKYSHTLDYRKRLPPGDPLRVLDYQTQVDFRIEIGGVWVTTYRADFVVQYEDREEVVDNKGMKAGVPYKLFQLKQRLMKTVLGITVIEQ